MCIKAEIRQVEETLCLLQPIDTNCTSVLRGIEQSRLLVYSVQLRGTVFSLLIDFVCVVLNVPCPVHLQCSDDNGPMEWRTTAMRSIECVVLLAWFCCCSAGAVGVTYPAVKTVHVITSCHLDIGFKDSSAGIINLYFDHHFPLAVSLGKQIRNGEFPSSYHDDRLNFMFQSWVVSLFLDCPQNMGLHCPNASAIADVTEAISHGDITWHAFPHNAQLELMSPAVIEAGLDMTFRLDDRFGVPRKRTLSQRDVPGISKSAIPILKKNGISAVSIGANGGSTPPDLPPCFVWKDIVSEESIFGLFTWPGYGMFPLTGSSAQQNMCVVDGLDHALVYNWNGDNDGPSAKASDYATRWSEISKVFPNAEVVASTFDNFTQHLETAKDRLPIVTAEVGDTWVYGAPSDPQKVSRMKVVNRELEQWAKKFPGGIREGLKADPVLRNATRFALKLGEHTWGKDVKRNLLDNYSWKNKDFERARQAGSVNASQYAALESSWWEQREWGITLFMETLRAAKHPLATNVEEGFSKLRPLLPELSGFSLVTDTSKIFHVGDSLEIGFDQFGSISHLHHEGMVWADKQNSLLQLRYRSYDVSDIDMFFKEYCKSNASWVAHDYGKPGLPSDVAGKIWLTTLEQLWTKSSATGVTFAVKLSFEKEAFVSFGAPESVWVTIKTTAHNLDITIGLFNKTTTRLPESMFVRFKPPKNSETVTWSASRIGEWQNVENVVDGGSKHLYGVTDEGIRARSSRRGNEQQMSVESYDAVVASFGLETAYPIPTNVDPNPEAFGSSFVLWDNLWGTNYVMWWPFPPPPVEYSMSSEYFPPSWNRDFTSRYNVSFV